MDESKSSKATFLAPLAAPVIYIFLLIIIIPLAPKQVMTNIVGLIFYVAYALPLGYIGSICIGSIIVTLLKDSNKSNVETLSIAGFFSGGIFFAVIVSIITGYQLSEIMIFPDIAWYFGVGGVMGTGVAYTYSIMTGSSTDN
jgi:hypothetical protein